MVLTPRIIVVDSISTDMIKSNQNLGLTLVDRTASADFYTRFPEGSPAKVEEVLNYAREHATSWIGKPKSSLPHKPLIYRVNGRNYHLGDVITEKAAFDLGYVEPILILLQVELSKQ